MTMATQIRDAAQSAGSGAGTNTVIATGCPRSGWDLVMSLLRPAGEDADGTNFASWHDAPFGAAGLAEPRFPDAAQALPRELPDAVVPGFAGDPGAPQLLADSRSLWLLDFWATRLPQARFLLFYTAPEAALAHALRAGAEPQQFLTDWQAANEVLLRFQRRHRRRALLLDAEAACRQPEALREACRRIDLVLPAMPATTQDQAAPLLERLVAGHLLAGLPGVRALHNELEASALPLAEALPVALLPPEDLTAHYRKRQAQERALIGELETMRLGLRDLERQHAQRAAALHELQAQLEQEQESCRTLQALNEDVRQENELLLLQLHQAQQELAALSEQAQAAARERQESGAQRQALRAELQQLQQRGAPELDQLRRQLDQARHQADAERRALQQQIEQGQQAHAVLQAAGQEAQQENDLLLLQLHQVQEELEELFLQKQAAEQGRQQADSQQQALRAELQQLTQQGAAELDQLRRQLDQARQQGDAQQQALRAELHQLKQQGAAELDQARHQADAERQALQQQLEHKEQAHAALEAANQETQQENELLLLQLHQVQEELEHYFLKYQELAQGAAAPASPADADGSTPLPQAPGVAAAGGGRWRIFGQSKEAKAAARRRKREHRRLHQEMQLIKSSGLFDVAWYLAEYEDVARSGVDPVKHYLRYGAAEGRDPSPRFETRFYLGSYPDVTAMGENPLVHFIRFGRAEGRVPSSRAGLV